MLLLYTRRAAAALVALAVVIPCASLARQSATPPENDLDRFMAHVLDRRDEDWKKLHDYILDETERFDLTGPADTRLYGMKRDYTWFVRDGYLIRSPLRYDGVTIGDGERRTYEERWLNEERSRENKRQEREKEQAKKSETDVPAPADQAANGNASLEAFVDQRGEPRFISEAFFLKFKFEAGNYYLAGREKVDGRDVVRVEYYPTKLINVHPAPHRDEKTPDKKREQDREFETRIQHDLNKVALVTLWIDPAANRIVRYTFDNVDFGFLPARWLVRLDSITMSMTMSEVFDGVWLPKEITGKGSFMLANGNYLIQYGRQFYNYKKGEVRARVRSVGRGDR